MCCRQIQILNALNIKAALSSTHPSAATSCSQATVRCFTLCIYYISLSISSMSTNITWQFQPEVEDLEVRVRSHVVHPLIFLLTDILPLVAVRSQPQFVQPGDV